MKIVNKFEIILDVTEKRHAEFIINDLVNYLHRMYKSNIIAVDSQREIV